MKKPRFSFFLVLILAFSAGLSAQQEEGLPYVSQIKAEPRNNLIRLTWTDSPDARGSVYIFKSTRPFSESEAIPPNLRPVTVNYGIQYYIDETDDIDNLYYFIAASDASGRRYDIIIQGVNSANVNQSAEAALQPSDVRVPASTQGISNLRASQDGDKVIITFDIAGPRKNAVLYRSRQPVRQPQDLLNAVIVQPEIISPFADFPVPGISWYYALIFEDDISGGNMGIRPGINTTTAAVMIPKDEPARSGMRPIPLPAMTLRNTMPEGYFLPDITDIIPLGEESANELKSVKVPSKAPLTLKKPRIFTVDLQSPSSGEESALSQIVIDFFEMRDWEGACISFKHFLSLPRSKDIEARARFYLGQALYYTGNYKEALFEFLSIRPLHPIEANIWIEAILTAMVY